MLIATGSVRMNSKFTGIINCMGKKKLKRFLQEENKEVCAQT